MEMRSNCSGSSRDSGAERIVRGRPGWERGGREYFKFLKAPTRTGKCGALNCQVGEKKDRPLLVSYVSICEKRFLVRSFFGHDLLKNWEPATLSNPTNVGEHRAFPSLTTAFFAVTGKKLVCIPLVFGSKSVPRQL
jgi:hypothetical protein